MATKKVRSKKLKDPVVQTQDGVVEGEYSTFIWENGTLVSFNIDWKKLSRIVKNLKNDI